MSRAAPGGEVSAAKQAYARIRRDIVSGALAPGERLTEQRVATELGLSRTPVRDAIRRLTHEGFIERGAGYSTRVARFPEDELDQLFQIRALLEAYAARRAARLATAEEVAELRRLADEMSARTPPCDEDDLHAISQANERFHRAVLAAARSPRLSVLLAAAIDVGVVARTYRSYAPRDLERSSRHHHEIVDAIAARAPEWAASAMTSHVLAAQASARSPYDDIPPPPPVEVQTEPTSDESAAEREARVG